MTTTAQNNATEGRVYGGDKGLIHIADGKRIEAGEEIAEYVDAKLRFDAFNSTESNHVGQDLIEKLSLCPGCYMVAMFNATIALARRNGQSLTELGNSMAGAFKALASEGGPVNIEHIGVILDASADFGQEYVA